MKILMVNKFLYANGGSETYIFKVGEKLQQMGHEVQYFGMENEKRIVGNHMESYTSEMNFHTGKIRKITYLFKIIYSFEARRKLHLVLEDFQPDVVHINNINFQLTPSIIDEIVKYRKDEKKKVKIIYTAHDYQWVCPNHMLLIPQKKELCIKCIDGKVCNCAKNCCIHNSRLRSIVGTIEEKLYDIRGTYGLVDWVICPSTFMKEILYHNSHIKNKLITLHNFVDLPDKENDVMADHQENKYVLYFGRYDDQKGIETLLKACRNLKKIKFIFAGKGPLEKKVSEFPNICNVGFKEKSELQNLIAAAQFTVFPSEWYENCPFSVMESLVQGVPVIASDLGGTAELIENGKTGELFDAGNEYQLTEKIRNLWENKERIAYYKRNCNEMFQKENRFFDSLQSYCEKLIDIYSDINFEK